MLAYVLLITAIPTTIQFRGICVSEDSVINNPVEICAERSRGKIKLWANKLQYPQIEHRYTRAARWRNIIGVSGSSRIHSEAHQGMWKGMEIHLYQPTQLRIYSLPYQSTEYNSETRFDEESFSVDEICTFLVIATRTETNLQIWL